MNINSKEYWDNRFETDWLDYAGDKQTAFFATILCDMLPASLIKEIMTQEYKVCDMGCALGEGIPIFSRKLGVDVDGMDFSVEAVKHAKNNYPHSNFWVGDLFDLEAAPKYDVVICSNVLEHFYNPWKILRNLAAVAGKYIIVMVPYHEKLDIDEHLYNFSEEQIPVQISGFLLDCVKTVDGKELVDSFYPDQQILLIYKKENNNMQMLSELTQGIVDSVNRENKVERNLQIEEFKKKTLDEHEDFCYKIESLKQNILNLKNELDEKEKSVKEKENTLNGTINELRNKLEKKEYCIQELEKSLYSKDAVINELECAFHNKESECLEKERAIYNARTLCYTINSRTSYKIFCVFVRFIKQLLLGSIIEKKAFINLCIKFMKREANTFTRNDRYNLVLNIANQLESSPEPENNQYVNISDRIKRTVKIDGTIISPNDVSRFTKSCLEKEYYKPDILIFSVINYEFRHQRPQHFAERFALNGHRVFYINANFVNRDSVKEEQENLYVVDFYTEFCNAIYYAADWDQYLEWIRDKMDNLINTYAIRDAMIILDYPNWIYGAEYLREEYGFRIIIDYMDDFTGFLGTTTDTLKENCIHMLKKSDLVIASSQFLYDIASKYAKKFCIVRNGTEFEHFYEAGLIQSEHNRNVIGYYGAVAHWFAWEKVCYLAEKLPECDIVIIGDVTEYRDKLEQYSNIKLMGEKKYIELPKYLADFDVCLIPFDTSTDLIKATNPVKFYEYLSAGKRIVATEIPELEPYRDEYVYMSNDNDEFLEYVKLCLNGCDKLKAKEDCVSLAKECDWQKRYEQFADACKSIVPKVSVIVLTYNNLELNKVCIKSILSKTAYPNYELIILDNMSTDGTVEYLKELEKLRYENVKIIFNDRNSGFAGGNNIGISSSTGEFILLLNNDTVVTRGWLTNAVKHLLNDPLCGMCGAVTNSIGNEAMIRVNYKNIKDLDCFAYQYTNIHNNQVYEDVDRLAMFCTVIRKEILENYGMLDENYEIGMFEDDDYAKLIKAAGYNFYIAEDVFVHHVNNASFKKLEDTQYKEIFEKNKRYYEKKWGVKWNMPKYREGVTAIINEGMMVMPK